MQNNQQFDIIVAGAGPAGSTFAKIAAKSGQSVLLLDKKHKIGQPVRCGEGIVESELRKIVEPREEWISSVIDTFSFIAPNNSSIKVKLKESGYILDRTIFDSDLAKMAEGEGAKVVTNAHVNGLLFENNSVSGVRGICDNKPFEIRAKLVIGADGVESRIGRMAGINTTLKMTEIDVGYQKTISGIDIEK